MSAVSKNELKYDNSVSFPNNNTGAITPADLRAFNVDLIDSTVNQTIYTAESASFNTRIVDTNTIIDGLLITASVAGDVLTFTKENGSSFNLVITASVATIPWDNVTSKPSGLVSGSSQVVSILNPLNTFSASQDTKNSTLATYTGSVDTKFSTLGTYTGSVDTKFTTIGVYTGSNDTKWNNLGSQSGSFVTESETGSFARTNTTNTFTATQTINADLIVSGTINAYQIVTTIESSSVIFSSGSNILGDATNDTQTLNGTVRVSGSQQITGSMNIDGDINMVNNSNLVTHHIKAQGSNGLELQTSNGTNIVQMGAGGGTQAAFVGAVTANSVSASTINGLGNPAAFSSSVDVRLARTATTGSNTFNGNQTINGTSKQTFAAPGDNTQTDFISVTGVNTSGKPYNYVNFGFIDYGGSGGNFDDSFAFECYDSTNYNYGSEITLNGQRVDFAVQASGSARVSRFSMRDLYTGNTFASLYADDMQFGEFSGGTATRIGIGHTALPTLQLKGQNIGVTGSLSINGNTIVTGSVRGNVRTQTITSNTASLDFSTTNFFELTLVSGSDTRVEATNVRPGQTVSLKVTQASVVGGTLTFSSQFDFPSISPYTATQSGSAVDVLTFVVFSNTGSIYSAGVNNLR